MRKYSTYLRNWKIEIACLTKVYICYLYKNSFITRIAKLKNILRLIYFKFFWGNIIRKCIWKCYYVLRISISIFFIYIPTSNYFLFQWIADFSPNYMAFWYFWLCVKLIDSFKDGFMEKNLHFHGVVSIPHIF